jgi:hypothetical protein
MPERKIFVLGGTSDDLDQHNAIVMDFPLPSMNGAVATRRSGMLMLRGRAELNCGQIEFPKGGIGGALVRMTVPLTPEETHAGA